MATQSTTNKNSRQNMQSSSAQRGRQQREEGYGQDSFLERGNEQLRDMVRDHEGQTVLVALGLGFGIGLMIGYSMAGAREPERWIDRVAAEGLGRRLLERFDRLLPESISSKFA